MKLLPCLRALVLACLSCALGACVMDEPDEAVIDDAVVMSMDGEGPEA